MKTAADQAAAAIAAAAADAAEKGIKMALSPMMQQYLRIHEAYPDCLLLFRLGDFYELFFEDAKTASRELELTLTGKDC